MRQLVPSRSTMLGPIIRKISVKRKVRPRLLFKTLMIGKNSNWKIITTMVNQRVRSLYPNWSFASLNVNIEL